MKLVSARITNFRCIEDSTEFSIDQVTCLVGKNEAGKTAVLKALYGLKPWGTQEDQFDKDRDYPRRYLTDYEERHEDEEAQVLWTKWRLEDDDIKALTGILGPAAAGIETVVVTTVYKHGHRWAITLPDAPVLEYILGAVASP